MSDILQEAESLIEKHVASGYIHRDATLLLPRLVSEIKRLRALECAAKANMTRRDEDIDDLMKELARKDADIAAWQKIAIDGRSLINFIEEEEGYAYSEHVILSDDEISIAAKELNLQLTQEASYLERLEKEFLDHVAARIYYESIPNVSDYWSWHDYPEEPCQMRPKQWFRDQAQAALEKIRRGQT